MKFLKRLFQREQAEDRLFVLGLDGVPLTFLTKAAHSGVMPNLAGVLQRGVSIPLDSVVPTVSTVAWANYATGVNPGKHGVFGFVDRHPNPFSVHIPSSNDIKVPTLWEYLSRAGKMVGVVNLPLTYPPRRVNGFMVGGFLSPDLSKATYPVELAPKLMEKEYRIDVDTNLAFEDMDAFMADLHTTMTRRFVACFDLMRSFSWDIFHLHVMSTDRLNHFLWSDQILGTEEGNRDFFGFYQKLDSYLGELLEQLPDGCRLALVSDHGFASTRALVFLNQWLEENGYLHFGKGQKELLTMLPDSRAYSLVPGRVFVNLEGREERGTVPQGTEYEDLRQELIHRISGISHPETNEPLIRRVYRREELYSGPHLGKAADLIVEPNPGFDLKANLNVPAVLGPANLPGMHVREGAFVHLTGIKDPPKRETLPRLEDLTATIMELLNVATPPGLDGHSIL
ncbi:alkaline phosphatase family protein [Dethiosulfatarculus sandiegensis]|uniref:Phosphodiesterase n=1 Tax=Dethiosulfatarculus sandiegensis TaxID=1429043 RepID=A0A0D2GCQ8_9BACT|nr:alkaline phosphatase family protein [Dethiosulfatarculus sandiegensis]KIX12732.1 hypothetical protein X474_17670 [Dethiosulfatarculus sandiegensis]